MVGLWALVFFCEFYVDGGGLYRFVQVHGGLVASISFVFVHQRQILCYFELYLIFRLCIEPASPTYLLQFQVPIISLVSFWRIIFWIENYCGGIYKLVSLIFRDFRESSRRCSGFGICFFLLEEVSNPQQSAGGFGWIDVFVCKMRGPLCRFFLAIIKVLPVLLLCQCLWLSNLVVVVVFAALNTSVFQPQLQLFDVVLN